MRRTVKKAKPKKATLLVRPSPLDRRKALLTFGPLVFRAALGRSGVASLKREGDGATPRATMRLLYGYRRGRAGAVATALPMKPIRPGMLWCDAPGHPAYNRPVSAPFPASHERLLRDDALYDVCLVLDWNVTSRRRGCGSAIFFHLAKPGYAPTEGCVAIARHDMARLLPFLDRRTVMTVL